MGMRLGVLGLLLLGVMPAAARDVDLHRLWEDRCSDCHGHAGDFAREHLRVEEGNLVGLHPERNLRRFLDNHYLARGEVEAVHAMLLAQATSQERYRKKCGRCHDRAAELARASLMIRDGQLYARQSGELISRFLTHHGRLAEEDIPFFVELLNRVTREVQGPRE